MKAFLEQKEVLFYSHTVNILRKKLPKRGHMPMYLGRTQKITTLIYILLCGFQMVWYTLSHLMNIILLIFHTTFEATEAQRIPYPITSNRGVRSPDPIITAFFYSIRAHTTQRKPSELVHKISPLGISLLKVKKKKNLFSAVLGLRRYAGFSWPQWAGATLHCGGCTSYCGGFFCCREWAASVVQAGGLRRGNSQALGRRRSSLAHGLSCSTAHEIFLDQESNLCLLHWRGNLSPPSHQGSPGFGIFSHTSDAASPYSMTHSSYLLSSAKSPDSWGLML